MDLEPAEAAENFNSRTHVECDCHNANKFFDLIGHISTHALTWSATD